MELDEMKSNWNSAKNNINARPDDCPGDNRRTALQRLGDKYRRFSIFSIIMAFCGPGLMQNAGISSPWIIAGYMILLGAGAVTDHILAGSIKAIDLSTMSVAEVLVRTLRCRKIHMWWVALAMPVSLLWCAFTAYTVHADIYLFWGICAGALVGFLIGLRILYRFLRDYRAALHN